MLAKFSATDPIRAEVTRSGLVESVDELSACIVDTDGSVIVAHGDIDRPLFYRSAIKPFQAAVSLAMGADLPPEHLAVACSSHSGHPVHLAVVGAILAGAHLDETALQTPPDWPLSERAVRRVVGSGELRPRSIYHNCSGKHAGFLAGCVAAGLDTATYLDADHALQRRVIELIGDLSGLDPRPVGIDGCGAPTLRGSVLGLARAFAHLGRDPDLERVRTACARFPSLVAANDRPDGAFARWWPGPVKTGAQGLLACSGNGFAAAVKSHSGSGVTATAALAEMLRANGVLSAAAVDALDDIIAPPVLGGGRPQGRTRIVLTAA